MKQRLASWLISFGLAALSVGCDKPVPVDGPPIPPGEILNTDLPPSAVQDPVGGPALRVLCKESCGARGNDCVLGYCDFETGHCATKNRDGTSCDDHRSCTKGDVCRGGKCVGTVACPAPDQCHEAAGCDKKGDCAPLVAKPAGTRCDDSDPCTEADSCSDAGVCVGNRVACSNAGSAPPTSHGPERVDAPKRR
jgi:hypothetical protein